MLPEGVLVVDKPAGPTSMRIVEQVKRLTAHRKAGHAGTLDPAASGILPICLGQATKLVPYLMGSEKEYVATVRLGLETDTFDLEGDVVAEHALPELSDELLAPHLGALTGEIMQRPPAFSALRSGGERLYAKARRGEAVVPDARPVVVHELELLSLEPPDVELRVLCGKGTYIRSLAADLGARLGCGGCLAALRRTRVGSLALDRSVTPDRLEELIADGAAADLLIPPADALAHLQAATLTAPEVDAIRQGRAVTAADRLADLRPATPCRLLSPAGNLVAIGERDGALLRPRRVLSA